MSSTSPLCFCFIPAPERSQESFSVKTRPKPTGKKRKAPSGHEPQDVCVPKRRPPRNVDPYPSAGRGSRPVGSEASFSRLGASAQGESGKASAPNRAFDWIHSGQLGPLRSALITWWIHSIPPSATFPARETRRTNSEPT